jgi:N-acyl amino acid synthase of PEP-CTERM/exosortase system
MTEEVGKSKSLSSPYFRFKTIAADTDPSNEERIFALRYQVYCLERSFLPPENYPNGLEKDEYDAFSTHVAAYSMTGMLVGSLRLVMPPDGTQFPFQVHCTRLFANLAYPPNRECMEVSRFVISKLYRRRVGDTVFGVSQQLLEESSLPKNAYDRRTSPRGGADRRKFQQPEILLGIFREAYRHCKQQGIGYWYMALEKPLVRLLKRLFYFSLEPIGEPVDYYGPVTPCRLSMEHFDDALSRGAPVLFAWFQGVLKE